MNASESNQSENVRRGDEGDGLNSEFIRRLLEHEPTVRAFLRPMLFSAEEVDEAMQRTSTVAWQTYASSVPIESFATWLCVIARYEALRMTREAARNPRRLGDAVLQLLADEGLGDAEDRQRELNALEKCLQKLPPDTRQAVMAAHRAGQSIKSVAESLGRSSESVYKRVQRARVNLLRCIEATLAGGESAGVSP